MKIAALLSLLLVSSAALAQSSYRPFETTEEARQRHNAERYDTYRQRGNDAPLGGYNDRLGDTAPRGTQSPGYGAGTSQPSQIDDRRSNPYQYDRRRLGW